MDSVGDGLRTDQPAKRERAGDSTRGVRRYRGAEDMVRAGWWCCWYLVICSKVFLDGDSERRRDWAFHGFNGHWERFACGLIYLCSTAHCGRFCLSRLSYLMPCRGSIPDPLSKHEGDHLTVNFNCSQVQPLRDANWWQPRLPGQKLPCRATGGAS